MRRIEISQQCACRYGLFVRRKPNVKALNNIPPKILSVEKYLGLDRPLGRRRCYPINYFLCKILYWMIASLGNASKGRVESSHQTSIPLKVSYGKLLSSGS